VQTHPVYNRFIWNFTRDITGGEVAYALNYNIRNANGDVAGAINEADANVFIPRATAMPGGHYLAAIKTTTVCCVIPTSPGCRASRR
jgi:hypothetical protein